MASKNKKRGLIARLQGFMSSYSGKVILNYAYSWGAAVVILGTLFKLTHLPGANIMLFVGMGTEVLVFLISAFDKPYKSYKWESVFPQIKINGANGKEEENNPENMANVHPNVPFNTNLYSGVNVGGYHQRVDFENSGLEPKQGIDNNDYSIDHNLSNENVNVNAVGMPPTNSASVCGTFTAGIGADKIDDMNSATDQYVKQLNEMTESLERFHKSTTSLANVSEALADSYKIISENSGNITANSQGYVHQMEILNRNLSGLNTIYEIQLHSISAQLDTIKQVNDGLCRIKEMYENSKDDSEKFHKETELMTKQIEELNAVYARMLQAMTVNMK